MSLNQIIVCEEDIFRDLGQRIGLLALEINVLPTISTGSKSIGPCRMYPPADFEAAILISGKEQVSN